jgi:hypothetical protein
MVIETYFINSLQDNWIIDCVYIEDLYSCLKTLSGCTILVLPHTILPLQVKVFYGFGGMQDRIDSFFPPRISLLIG